tara:strand:+ start:555 stop:902 length:348 start_codon:yes stop_codon:yes gene_type:complete
MKIKIKMAEEISVFDSEEFERLVAEKDIRISNALVDTVLKNLKGRKRHIHALSIMVEQDLMVYDITIDRKEFLSTLESSLPVYEEVEEFEKCAEIFKAINFLKNKPKRGRPKKLG